MPTISGTITADELKQLWMFSLPYSRSSWLLADVFYRRVTMPPLDMLGLPSGGVLALLLASFVFLTALVFAARPFYRPHLGYGSPPLAIRSGLLAFACIPLFIALTGKVDLVTMLTGISHEKLDVLHQWVACFGFGLSIAHMIPFLVASYQDEGYARVKSEFYAKGVAGKNEVSGSYPRPSTYKTHTA
jgi:Ferric reductase like transmembrane component